MARSPLLSALRRHLAALRISQATGEEVAGLIQRAREVPNQVSRRTVLAGAAGTAGLAACATLPRVNRGDAPDVLIVGAGIAGLTCAWRLRQAGVPVQVVEAQERAGGRMRSLAGTFAAGQVAELGGELIDTGHTAIQGLAVELGLALEDLASDAPELARDTWYVGGAHRTDAEVVEAFHPVARALSLSQARLGALSTLARGMGGDAAALDHISLAEWLERCGADAWMRELLTLSYTAEYGLETDVQSCLNLLTMMEPSQEAFLLFGESDERFHIAGGNERLPRALAERLGDALAPGRRLVAVRPASDGRLACTFEGAGGTRDVVARHVVLALPFTLLREVELALPLPSEKREAIASLSYGTNSKLMLGVSERVWRTRHRRHGSSVCAPVQLTWETSRQQPGAAGILTCFTGGKAGLAAGEGITAERGAAVADALESVFPGLAAAHTGQPTVRAHWPSHPWARGSYASYGVGQRTRFGGVEGERVGNLHFAGEHCAGDLQGFMEGAVVSG
ncbi:MAG: FAD-dependent oxidoreductase, partial [Myxococcaceae bacterium]|nr:FAD-dependent oxidoreductase [Myxococcaceae bacterium]